MQTQTGRAALSVYKKEWRAWRPEKEEQGHEQWDLRKVFHGAILSAGCGSWNITSTTRNKTTTPIPAIKARDGRYTQDMDDQAVTAILQPGT